MAQKYGKRVAIKARRDLPISLSDAARRASSKLTRVHSTGDDGRLWDIAKRLSDGPTKSRKKELEAVLLNVLLRSSSVGDRKRQLSVVWRVW